MSSAAGSLDYAQARLQARHGARSDAAAAAGWQRIETVRDFGALLDAARATALRPWLVGITATSSSHEIEAALRTHWREFVAEVAGWMPPAWQPAVAWCDLLPDLAPLQHLARGEEPAAWLRADPAWRELAAVADGGRPDPAARPDGAAGRAGARPAVGPAQVAALLRSVRRDPAYIGRAWTIEWHRRWPPMSAEARRSMADFERAMADHITRYAHGHGRPEPPHRAAPAARLALLWRRVALQPAAAFVHLALAAIDLQRLRAELLRRRLFPRWSPARC